MHFKCLYLFFFLTVMFSCRSDEIIPISDDPIEESESEDIGERVISGNLTNEFGETLSDVQVDIYLQKELRESLTTDDDGNFLFITEEIGEYFIYVDEQNYLPALVKVDSTEPQSNEVQISIIQGEDINSNFNWLDFDWVSVKGQMIDELGAGKSEVKLFVRHLVFDYFNFYCTDSDGYFEYLVAKDIPHSIDILSHCSEEQNILQLGFDEDFELDPIVIEDVRQIFHMDGFVRDCNNNTIQDPGMFEVELISENGLVSREIVSYQGGGYFINHETCEDIVLVNVYSYPDFQQLAILTNFEGENDVVIDIIICDDFEEEHSLIDLTIGNRNYSFSNVWGSHGNNDMIRINFQNDNKFGDFGFIRFQLEKYPEEEEVIVDDFWLEINQWEFFENNGDLELTITKYPEQAFDVFSGVITGNVYDYNNDTIEEISCQFQFLLFIK